jgi:hypothetical protein
MRPGSASAAVLGCALAFLLAPSGSRAAAPPSRDDPCAKAGRDTCNTAGTGFYRQSRYGTRWYGDYRNAVPGHPRLFCIDLRYWYASRSYNYRPATGDVLLNRDGETVTPVRQARLAYAIARFGRTSVRARQVAVMLYVHSQMGDARPGELDPTRLGAAVATQLQTVSRETSLLHGPYRLEARLASGLTVGAPATASIRLVSSTGHPLPGVRLALTLTGADGPVQTRTNDEGAAVVPLTPRTVDVRLGVVTARLPSSKPSIFLPTHGAAAANGQRLAAPAFVQLATTATGQASPLLNARVDRAVVRPRAPFRERIRVHGLGTTPAAVEVGLYGPFPNRSRLHCSGPARWTHTITVSGPRVLLTPPVAVTRVGFYVFRAHVVGTPAVPAVMSGCPLSSQTTLVAPRIVAGRGAVSQSPSAPGAGGGTPVRIRIPSLAIAAAVRPVTIDVTQGTLGLPKAIGRTGWWRDGMQPGTTSGAVLIAGHVDSAKSGPGAFFALRRATRGALVRIATSSGETFDYRVRSVVRYGKRALPLGIYARDGPPRLVLVTCGGPFDAATGHYRDNIVVTAVPVAD